MLVHQSVIQNKTPSEKIIITPTKAQSQPRKAYNVSTGTAKDKDFAKSFSPTYTVGVRFDENLSWWLNQQPILKNMLVKYGWFSQRFRVKNIFELQMSLGVYGEKRGIFYARRIHDYRGGDPKILSKCFFFQWIGVKDYTP